MKTPDLKAFFDKVQKQYTVMNGIGNPFMEETGYLFKLDTKVIAHPSVDEIVASRYKNVKTRFSEFFKGLDFINQSRRTRQISFSKGQNQIRMIQSKTMLSVLFSFHILSI